MATKIAIDMDLFRHLRQLNSPVAGHAQLASAAGADPLLTKRILRVLGANGIIDELGVDEYILSPLSKTLLTPEAAASITLLVDVQMPCDIGVPAWLRSRKFRSPSGPDDCPWNEAMNTDQSHFEWLKAHPDRLREFGGLMKGFNESRIAWTDFFPVGEFFDEQATAPFMVDVGGGVGHDLRQVLKKIPRAAGRLYLQRSRSLNRPPFLSLTSPRLHTTFSRRSQSLVRASTFCTRSCLTGLTLKPKTFFFRLFPS